MGDSGERPQDAASERLAAQLREGKECAAKLDLRAARLSGEDLSDLDLTGLDLSGADLSEADLSRTVLRQAKLGGANLIGARLDGAELLMADLREANLDNCRAESAGFGGANLEGARMRGATLNQATFSQAKLAGADLCVASLEGARFREADLREAQLVSARLGDADLSSASVHAASFREADLRGARFTGIRGFDSADWIGVDVRDADFRGSLTARRLILDENFLHEFRQSSRASEWIYQFWRLTSDCGRSLGRWGICTVGLIVLFAGLFLLVDMDYGHHDPGFLSSFYFSVVTLTTLGYGDILPASPTAQVLVIAEVVIGYLTLGGLISIFASKMARRAE